MKIHFYPSNFPLSSLLLCPWLLIGFAKVSLPKCREFACLNQHLSNYAHSLDYNTPFFWPPVPVVLKDRIIRRPHMMRLGKKTWKILNTYVFTNKHSSVSYYAAECCTVLTPVRFNIIFCHLQQVNVVSKVHMWWIPSNS